jgi:hypothetical protein
MNIRTYVLPKEDVERAAEAGGPLADVLDWDHVRNNMAIPVVEIDGAIVAYWCLFYALHAEPLFVHEAWRKHPGVIGGIVEALMTEAYKTGERSLHVQIRPDDVEHIRPYAERLGFIHDPGEMFYKVMTPVQPALEPVEG